MRCARLHTEMCVRVIGGDPDFYRWQRGVTYPPDDKGVVLLTNYENHMTDTALYEQMKCAESIGRI